MSKEGFDSPTFHVPGKAFGFLPRESFYVYRGVWGVLSFLVSSEAGSGAVHGAWTLSAPFDSATTSLAASGVEPELRESGLFPSPRFGPPAHVLRPPSFRLVTLAA